MSAKPYTTVEEKPFKSLQFPVQNSLSQPSASAYAGDLSTIPKGPATRSQQEPGPKDLAGAFQKLSLGVTDASRWGLKDGDIPDDLEAFSQLADRDLESIFVWVQAVKADCKRMSEPARKLKPLPKRATDGKKY